MCIIIAFNQSNVTANLLYSEHAKFQEDVILANRVNFQLDSMGIGDRSNYSLVLLGKHVSESVFFHDLGHSFFAWDIGTKQGIESNRIYENFRLYVSVSYRRTIGLCSFD